MLYTEMIVADAILRGDRKSCSATMPLNIRSPCSSAGSDPTKMAEAARIGRRLRLRRDQHECRLPVRPGAIGHLRACLMQEPALVADCIAAMKAAVKIPVTVKCRIGVDDQDPEVALSRPRPAVSRMPERMPCGCMRERHGSKGEPEREPRGSALDYGLVHRLRRKIRIFSSVSMGAFKSWIRRYPTSIRGRCRREEPPGLRQRPHAALLSTV